MSSTPQYLLHGGPCAGKTGNITPAIADTGVIECQGHLYRVSSPAQHVAGRLVFNDAGAAQQTSGGPQLPAGHKGYNEFQKAYATTLPTKLARSKATRRAALRKLGAPRRIQNL